MLKQQGKLKIFTLGIVSSLWSQLLSIIVSMVSIPIGIKYFGPEKYGIWLVLNSMLTYLNASQFGIGIATTTLIAKSKNSFEQQEILSCSFTMLGASSLFFIFLTLGLSRYPNIWFPIFGKISTSLQIEAFSAAFFLFLLFFIRLPTIAFTSTLNGLQKMHLERFYTVILPSLIGFIGLLLVIFLNGNLILLSIFTGIGNLIIGIISWIHISISYRELRLRRVHGYVRNNRIIRDILYSGGRFFVIGLAAMVVWNTDNLVINFYLGPKYVTAYAVTFKLFTTAYSLLFMINSVLWPMYGKAISENDWNWIRNVYNSLTAILPVFGGLIWIGGVAFSQNIITRWTGEIGYGGALVVFALGGYGYLVSLNNTNANFLGGMNSTENMLWIGILEALTNVIFSIVLINIFGIGGVALGTFFAALITVFWLLPLDIVIQTKGEISLNWHYIFKQAILAVIPFVAAVIILNKFIQQGWLSFFFKLSLIAIYLMISWIIIPSNIYKKLKFISLSYFKAYS